MTKPGARKTYAQKLSEQRYYRRRRGTVIARARASNKAQKARVAGIVRQAKEVPCADCGIQYPYYVMQFDHVGDEKNFTIGRMAHNSYVSIVRLRHEIGLCEVVCANCHAERTWQRQQESGTTKRSTIPDPAQPTLF